MKLLTQTFVVVAIAALFPAFCQVSEPAQVPPATKPDQSKLLQLQRTKTWKLKILEMSEARIDSGRLVDQKGSTNVADVLSEMIVVIDEKDPQEGRLIGNNGSAPVLVNRGLTELTILEPIEGHFHQTVIFPSWNDSLGGFEAVHLRFVNLSDLKKGAVFASIHTGVAIPWDQPAHPDLPTEKPKPK